jgi:predicted small secreted protein
MKAVFLRNCTLLLAASLAACSTTRGGGRAEGGAEVTATHLGQTIARGQIAVEAFDAADANAPEFQSYASAVAQQLSRLGWTVVDGGGRSEQVALIDVQQGSRAALTGRIGVPGGTATAGASATGTNATLLEVRIRRRSDGTVIWEGRAVGEAPSNSAAGQQGTAVPALAAALFRDFPGVSGRTVRVR